MAFTSVRFTNTSQAHKSTARGGKKQHKKNKQQLIRCLGLFTSLLDSRGTLQNLTCSFINLKTVGIQFYSEIQSGNSRIEQYYGQVYYCTIYRWFDSHSFYVLIPSLFYSEWKTSYNLDTWHIAGTSNNCVGEQNCNYLLLLFCTGVRRTSV